MPTIDSSSFSRETANFKGFYRIPLGRLKVSLHFCDGKIRKVEGGLFLALNQIKIISTRGVNERHFRSRSNVHR